MTKTTMTKTAKVRLLQQRREEEATVTPELSVRDLNLEGKLVKGRHDVRGLIAFVTGGFGCTSSSGGSAVFVTYDDGSSSRWDRSDVLRLATSEESAVFHASQLKAEQAEAREVEVKTLTESLPGLLVNLVTQLEAVTVNSMPVAAFKAYNAAREALRSLGMVPPSAAREVERECGDSATTQRHTRYTRYSELTYRCDGPKLWRIVATDTGSVIGPQYATKVELLADLERFACEYGCK